MLKLYHTMGDSHRRKDRRIYPQAVIRNAKSAGLDGSYQHMMMIYNHIDYELRRDLTKPKEDTSLDKFLMELDDCKDGWLEFISMRPAKPLWPLGTRFAINEPTYQGQFQGSRGYYRSTSRGRVLSSRPHFNYQPFISSIYPIPNQDPKLSYNNLTNSNSASQTQAQAGARNF